MWPLLVLLLSPNLGTTGVLSSCGVSGTSLKCTGPDWKFSDVLTVGASEQPQRIQQMILESNPTLRTINVTELVTAYPNLANLTVQNSSLQSVTGAQLFEQSKLELLDLSNNQIEQLPWRLLARGKQLKILNLTGNPLACDCQHYWIFNFTQLAKTPSFVGSVPMSTVNEGEKYFDNCDYSGKRCEEMSVVNVVKLPHLVVADKYKCFQTCALPNLTIRPHNRLLTISPNERWQLTCVSSNQTTWRWKDSAFNYTHNSGFQTDPLTNHLIIEKSSTASSGWIFCENDNEFIPLVKAIPLDVKDKPLLLTPVAGDRGHSQVSYFLEIIGAGWKNLSLTRNGYPLGITHNPLLTVVTPSTLSQFFMSRWKLSFSNVPNTCASGEYELTACNRYQCDRKNFNLTVGGCQQADCPSLPLEQLRICPGPLRLEHIPSPVNESNSTYSYQPVLEKAVVSAEVLTLGSVAFVISLLMLCGVLILAGFYYVRHKRLNESSKRYRLETFGLEPLTENSNRPIAPLTETNFNYAKFNRSLLFDGSTPYIDESFLDSVKELGEGAFGRVCLVRLNFGEIVDKEQENLFLHGVLPELMAMKQLKFATPERVDELKNEAKVMMSLSHPNIVGFLGISSHRGSFCFLFEYMENGDLANYMRDRSPESSHTGGKLTLQQQLNFCIQITNGMKYLAEKHYVHRDLAARNCLVGANERVKISDFGMTRDTYITDYYKMGHQALLPIRWLPPESFLYGRFTVESDVWSCGVVIWEIFSYGRVPWYMYSNSEVLKCISEGEMLVKPEICPDEVYQLMQSCWKKVPTDRVTMTQLHQSLSTLLASTQILADYVCLLQSPSGDVTLLPATSAEEKLPVGAVEL